MSEHVDVIVIGMGPGGEVAAGRLLARGKRVAVIERELIGGECTYWACIPSKTVLRPPEAGTEVDRAAGVDGARSTGLPPATTGTTWPATSTTLGRSAATPTKGPSWSRAKPASPARGGCRSVTVS